MSMQVNCVFPRKPRKEENLNIINCNPLIRYPIRKIENPYKEEGDEK